MKNENPFSILLMVPVTLLIKKISSGFLFEQLTIMMLKKNGSLKVIEARFRQTEQKANFRSRVDKELILFLFSFPFITRLLDVIMNRIVLKLSKLLIIMFTIIKLIVIIHISIFKMSGSIRQIRIGSDKFVWFTFTKLKLRGTNIHVRTIKHATIAIIRY